MAQSGQLLPPVCLISKIDKDQRSRAWLLCTRSFGFDSLKDRFGDFLMTLVRGSDLCLVEPGSQSDPLPLPGEDDFTP